MRTFNFFFSILFTFLFVSASGQNSGIDFRIEDEHGIPIENAEVRFVNLPDSSLIGTQYTGRSGVVINGISSLEDMVLRITAPHRQTVWWKSQTANKVGIVTLLPDMKGGAKNVHRTEIFTSSPPDSNNINGEWEIDLRPSPDAAKYTQALIIQCTDEKHFSGSFYNTSFENGTLNDNWEGLHFAFSTKDRKAVYVTVGHFDGEKLRGVTFCEKRDFVMPWTGVRK